MTCCPRPVAGDGCIASGWELHFSFLFDPFKAAKDTLSATSELAETLQMLLF